METSVEDQGAEPQKRTRRELAMALLRDMSDVHPQRLFDYPDGVEEQPLASALRYLEDLGLCKAGVSIGADGHISFTGATISARGLDYLEEDGGLSAELGVVTVRFEAETLRQILEARIDAEAMPAESKSLLKTMLKDLPASALKAATTELMKQGLTQMPNAIHWLRTLAGHG